MNIIVKVKTKSTNPRIESFGNNRYLVYLASEPKNNEANIELIKMLSKHFGTPAGKIKIKHGFSGDEKLVEVG
jgi:uncharacterized protein YggU (UPF0235/DUF167 family)